VQQGLTESLAGRFEVLRLPHWSFAEMRAAFGFTLDQYLYFGGYPGAAPLVHEPARWKRYVLDSLVETTIARDVLLLTRVDKPALLRHLFELGCRYSGQVLSYTKMLGQLHDAGNTTTLAHYLELLSGSGLLTGLPKYSGKAIRQRGSSPKIQVFNSALMTAQSTHTFEESLADHEFRGRLVESAVGAHLVNAASVGECEVFYWREGHREVDYVVRAGRRTIAVEVKSGGRREALPGLAAFTDAFRPTRTLLVGGDGIPVEEFLLEPVGRWVEG
jgi:predicted AAA+ superfamily ATPase